MYNNRALDLLQMNHDDLLYPSIDLLSIPGKKWKCSNSFCNLKSIGNEIPDCLGFACGFTSIVEVKVSRSDFFADKKKPFRQRPHEGVGNYRFYLTPPDLIHATELPNLWGLAEYNPANKKIIIIKNPLAQDSNTRLELAMATTIIRKSNSAKILNNNLY
jgi:hypothetical protein